MRLVVGDPYPNAPGKNNVLKSVRKPASDDLARTTAGRKGAVLGGKLIPAVGSRMLFALFSFAFRIVDIMHE